MLKNKYKQLMIILSIFAMSSANADIYKIEKEDSNLIGKTIKINKPMAYISGIELCNNLKDSIAYNTDCFLDGRGQYKLTELTTNCHNCLDSDRLTKKRRLHYKENIELKVIDVYKATHKKITYRIMNTPISFVLLEDNDKNKIEILKPIFDNLETDSSHLNKEQKKIESNYNLFKDSGFLVKTFCFYDMKTITSEEQFENVKKLVKDFDLDLRIEKYSHCRTKGKAGVNVILKRNSNFSEFLTFDFYKGDWGLAGRWQ